MYEITLLKQPNSYNSFNINTDGYDLRLKTVKNYLYADLYKNGNPLFYGRRCINKMPLIQNQKQGNFYFYDKYGNDNPVYDKLNDRFVLIYDENYLL